VIASLADRWTPEPVAVTAGLDGEHLIIDMRAATDAPGDLVALDDRVGALDGALTVETPAPGQTRVKVQLPCA
jgi:hypothetical protein